MKSQELLKILAQKITPDEWYRIEHGDPSLIISSFNRKVLISMHTAINAQISNFDIDIKTVQKLTNAIESYLQIHMADKIDGHKWIIISSIYLTFFQKLPMHPQQAVPWITHLTPSNEVEYICPIKDTKTGSICSYCVCKSAS